MNKDVTIVGAGIGGLATAIAWSKCGGVVKVFERSAELSEAGAGIWIPPNAMQIFDRLGVADDIRRSGVEISRAELHDYRAGLLQEIETKSTGGYFTVAIHRQRLQRILATYAAKTAEIRYAHPVAGLKQDRSRVLLQFPNAIIHEAKLVIGCDGIHSAVRQTLFPKVQPRYSGQTSWRAVVTHQLAAEFAHQGREIWAPAARFGFSRLSENEVYWYATADAPEGESESHEEARSRLLRMAEPFPAPVGELVSATLPEAIIRTDLWDLPTLENWHCGRVLLLGDAAHATTPNLGQGAAQAVEDSWMLAQLLAGGDDFARAFEAFEQKRRKRTEMVIRRAWQLGKLAHLGGPKRQLRNFAFWLTPGALLRAQTNALYEPQMQG